MYIVAEKCEALTCDSNLNCKIGYKIDDDGCETCECEEGLICPVFVNLGYHYFCMSTACLLHVYCMQSVAELAYSAGKKFTIFLF